MSDPFEGGGHNVPPLVAGARPSTKKREPTCKCDRTNRRWYPSNPYECIDCLNEKQKQRKRSHPGNVHLMAEELVKDSLTTQPSVPDEDQGSKTPTTEEKNPTIPRYNCDIHGPHNGHAVAGMPTKSCPKCFEAKRVEGMLREHGYTIRMKLGAYPWLLQWAADQAGCDAQETRAIAEWCVKTLARQVPAEFIKDFLLKE